MKNQALFSSKDKNEKSKCRLLQFLFGALRVNSLREYQYAMLNIHEQQYTVELYWLEHLWNHENSSRRVVGASKC